MVHPVLAQAVSRHVTMTPAELAIFCAAFRPLQVPKKSFLLQAGEVCQYEVFVTRGCLRLYALDHAGHEYVLYFATEGWWMTDLDSFTQQRPSQLFIEALEDTELLAVGRADKERLYAELPVVEKLFRVMTQKTHVFLQRRVLAGFSQTADVRYREFIGRYPQLAQRLSQVQLAAYLGITPEFLSKIRKKPSPASQENGISSGIS